MQTALEVFLLVFSLMSLPLLVIVQLTFKKYPSKNRHRPALLAGDVRRMLTAQKYADGTKLLRRAEAYGRSF
jgi:hypothetical protein